jgi:hypothetical protein
MRRLVWPILLVGFLVAPPALAYLPWCHDWLVVEVIDDTVLVEHRGAEYNCCPADITHDVTFGEGRIDVWETEILAEDICLCNCCYEVTAEIAAVPAGDWVVHLHYLEWDTGEWVDLTFPIQIAPGGPGGTAHLADSYDSGCQEPGTPVREPVEETSWGRLKARWH